MINPFTGDELSDSHPMVVAWRVFKESEEYRDNVNWNAAVGDRGMWVAFVAGWNAVMDRVV